MSSPRFYSLSLFLSVLLSACGDEMTRSSTVVLLADMGSPGQDAFRPTDGEMSIDSALNGNDAGKAELPSRCVSGMTYEAGVKIFQERTEEWGLITSGVMGTRLTVGDLDGDGFADLIVRRGGRRSDVFSDDPETARRHHWVLKNRGDGFEDVTLESGFLAVRGQYPIAVGRPVEVVAFADVDGDGDQDIYSGLDTRMPVELNIDGMEQFIVSERSELLLNDGSGIFTLAPMDHPLRRVGADDVPSGAAFADYDLDGHIDLWISQGGLGAPLQDRLFAGDGTGRFQDVTRDVGLTTSGWNVLATINQAGAHTTAWSAAACDLNGDGYPDFLAGSYGRAPNHLWRAVPTPDRVTFSNESVASGYAFDENQNWENNQFARCYCRSQPEAEGCSGVPAPEINCSQQNWRHNVDREPFRNGGNSGATVCVDLNNDGWLDLYTTEIRHWWAGDGSDASEVLVNQQDENIRFSRPGRRATGLTLMPSTRSWDEGHITAGAIDFDNDGRQDLYLGATDYPGNRGHLYRNISQADDLAFVDVPTADFFEHNRSHGMAIADFDHDGDLDLVVGHSRSRCGLEGPNPCNDTAQVRFFENIIGNRNNWIQLDLDGGEGSNRGAIGARVTVLVNDQTLVQEVGGGYGHFGAQTDRVLHFGIGAACEATVIVRWPNQNLVEQEFVLAAGYRYQLTQGGTPIAIDMNRNEP